MPRIVFTPQLQRHVSSPACEVDAADLRSALELVFTEHKTLRGYVLDDQGHLRKHVAIFIDGARVGDRIGLSDPLTATSEVYILQALSGG